MLVGLFVAGKLTAAMLVELARLIKERLQSRELCFGGRRYQEQPADVLQDSSERPSWPPC